MPLNLKLTTRTRSMEHFKLPTFTGDSSDYVYTARWGITALPRAPTHSLRRGEQHYGRRPREGETDRGEGS